MIQKLEEPGEKKHRTLPKVDDLRCTHFRLMTQESMVALHHKGEIPIASLTKPDGSAGKILILNSATTFDMLSEYHLTLLNHQAYAEHHHYAYVLALVKPVELRGRSAKFAKHLAMGTQLAQAWIPGRPSWDTVCHMDLDAWHASWAPFSSYGAMWPSNKDLLLGDTGQIWLNTGLICARPTRWALRFFDRVINAVFLQFGMSCPKHGQKKPRFHIKDRVARFGHMRATQTRIRLSVGTGVTGMLYSAQV
mmetsp:Transcript_13402/g.52483  ORF Transcript_13402/g.52483 Transcript_13402/m.52483 type:complete len:250 (-) Transcript_13402:1515-2264(-)